MNNSININQKSLVSKPKPFESAQKIVKLRL